MALKVRACFALSSSPVSCVRCKLPGRRSLSSALLVLLFSEVVLDRVLPASVPSVWRWRLFTPETRSWCRWSSVTWRRRACSISSAETVWRMWTQRQNTHTHLLQNTHTYSTTHTSARVYLSHSVASSEDPSLWCCCPAELIMYLLIIDHESPLINRSVFNS